MSKVAFEAAVGRQNVFLFNPDDLKIVEDKDHPLYQPHRTPLPVDPDLVRSIMFNGFRSIIKVRKDGPNILVVDGRQRVKAAREANRQLVEQGKQPVNVTAYQEKGDDADMAGLMILANHGHKNDNPIEEARELSKYLALGRTEEQAAAVFCVPVSTIKRMRTLLELAPKVQKAIEAGTVSTTAAVRLAKFDRAEQEKRLDELQADGGKVTVSRMARTVKAESGKTDGPVPPKARQIREVVERIKKNPSGVSAIVLGVLDWVSTGSVPAEVRPLADALKAIEAKGEDEDSKKGAA